MKALVIEDNQEILSFLKNGLQYENFLVDAASDGEMALQKALNNNYDVFIVDLLLPKIDGMQFIEKMRTKGNTTPAIVLTAIKDPETKIKLLNMGADDFIEKPFSFNELLARIRTVLRRVKPQVKLEIYKMDNLIVNPMTREVTRGGKNIILTKKEFSLLEYLISHPNEAINQAVLLEKVWDFNKSAFSNTLGTHVSSLRRKIDKEFKKKLIKTVHGIGYKISDEY
jgi:DNA-binding response OmpR family regulator